MIADSAEDITRAVLAEAGRTPDARQRELLQAAIRHLHAFASEVRLTEAEFFGLVSGIARAGRMSDPSHNEVMLAAGVLGLSALVCRLNNDHPITANQLGPFWRSGPPPTESGGSIVRSPTPGEPVLVRAEVVDADGRPVEGAAVDVWHASTEGFYENQDPAQADMNLRGRFTTDAAGRFEFHTVKPAGYPVPVHGPVGDLLRLQGRHNLRPAHIHFLIAKAGFKTQFAQVYSSDDEHLETDVVFAVTRPLVGRYVERDGGGWTLSQRFVLQAGVSRLPEPPISGKAEGPRPRLEVLRRR